MRMPVRTFYPAIETRRPLDLGDAASESSPASARQIVDHYFASALVYGLALAVVTVSPHFRTLLDVPALGVSTARLYGLAYLGYLSLAPLVLFAFRPRSLCESKNVVIVGYLGRLLRNVLPQGRTGAACVWRPSHEETQALAFLAIKVFFGPLMISSVLFEWGVWPERLRHVRAASTVLDACDAGYLFLVSSVFLVDSGLFVIGYHTEAALLKNRVRYVETNPLRVLVCVACYAPFSVATGALLGPSHHGVNVVFRGDLGHPVTWLLRGAAALLLLVMLSASASLFTKASNLTNRGIVQHGPYRFIRHPGYLAKNLFWLVTLVPALFSNPSRPDGSPAEYVTRWAIVAWGMVGWGTIYFLRALAEEAFLMKDPEYVAYCEKVKYRFIPGVY
jgi:protein-S-isoprenylcysteine O-methyltransferase Ste14